MKYLSFSDPFTDSRLIYVYPSPELATDAGAQYIIDALRDGRNVEIVPMRSTLTTRCTVLADRDPIAVSLQMH